jgi:primosomal protein N' (replication factor Y)
MADAGLLIPGLLPPLEEFRPPDLARPGPVLDADQAEAAALLRSAVARAAYSTTLLSGVTGSGKTEVYFEAIAAALQAGRQALVLLPEIALWHRPSTLAFRAFPPHAPHHLARRGRRPRNSAGRRAFGAVPALSGSWPDCGG